MKKIKEETVQRHCGLDPQSHGKSSGDSCFRRNDGVDWNNGRTLIYNLENRMKIVVQTKYK
jgi:hypothetical protein